MANTIARLLSIIALLTPHFIYAIEIPKSLEEWKPWVLEKHPTLNCPIMFNEATRTCVWPSELRVNATNTGAAFLQRVEIFQSDWVTLPGNTHFWPKNVNDNNKNIAVRDNGNIPEVYLTQGVHELSGSILWNELPRTLQVPQQTGLVQLTLNGKSITNPSIENTNQLWLSASNTQSTATHQDTFNLRVFRKIADDIPLRVTTLLQIDVSGKERELQLGQLLPSGFTATEFNSVLPARIEKDGSLQIQVKPGSWELTLVSQSNTPLNDLTFKSTSELWPQQEIWVFESQAQLRSVQISGVQTIDPQQTQLPEDWKQLPAYLVTPETHFKMEELQRGENKDAANKLQLKRKAWLGFDGNEFIMEDELSGTIQGTRLETIRPFELTNASIDNEPQLITHLAQNKNTGIEVRTHNISITGISHLPRSLSLAISGWNEEFHSISTYLYLPPGWSLLTATATSSESGSWISKWTLWDMFLVLIIAVAIGRTTKPIYGLLAAITLVVIYQRSGAPIFIWLNLIATLALIPFVSGKFKKYVVNYTYLSFIFLALTLLPFAVSQARAIINPQLEALSFYDMPSLFDSPENQTYSEAAPAAAPAISMSKEMSDSAVDEIVVTGAQSNMSLQRFGKNDAKNYVKKKINTAYDPDQQTQTGIAIPSWNENSVYLEWSGPVKANETTQLYLVSPLMNRIGYLLCVILPLLLASILVLQFLTVLGKKLKLPQILKTPSSLVTPSLLLLALWFTPNPGAQADVAIDQTILKELEERLTQAPKCLPNCAAIESVNLMVNDDQLTLDMWLHSSDFIALPLPADREQWWPNQITVDGKNATVVKKDARILLVSLPKGRHNLIIKANLQGRDALSLQFPISLHNVSSNSLGWDISGTPTAEQASQSLQLQRVERNETLNKSEHLRPDPISAFVIVRRELQLNLEWTVTTTITRVAPALGAINLEIPLLDGESPLTTQVNSKGKVAIHFEANQHSVDWTSTLKQATPLPLQAAANVPWVEVWALQVSPIWHTEIKGISPIQFAENENTPIWQPWPGEILSLDITRPEATKGNYVTVDSAALEHQLGNRSNESIFNLSIRTNQGGQYSFALPQGSILSSMKIDNAQVPIAAVNGTLKIPLHPGEQNIALSWKTEEGVGIFSRSPLFSLDQGSSNQNISVKLPYNRWPLFVGGPMVGPSILIWGMLFVVVIIAFALGRSQLTPLKSYQWILLCLGICTQSFVTFIVVAIWLIVLQQRGKLQHISSALTFKWMQLGLFIFSLIALACLIGTIPAGLLGSPDMHLVGNNSYAGVFNWYQDHSDSAFPTAWIISLPLWCYKVAILLWALWLASALTGWIRWAWQQLGHQALWYAPAEIIPQAMPATPKVTTTTITSNTTSAQKTEEDFDITLRDIEK
jgi:hypothetical protein